MHKKNLLNIKKNVLQAELEPESPADQMSDTR
jgi:hypothetical protein